MHFHRRDLLKLALAGAARCAAPAPAVRSGQKLRILVLGGTSFLGPQIVSRALAAGHTVTLFNRGKTHPELFPGVERIRGDRQPDGGDFPQTQWRFEWGISRARESEILQAWARRLSAPEGRAP